MKEMNITADMSKAQVFDQIRSTLGEIGLQVSAEDQTRPWGGFFVLEESQISLFRSKFFEEVPLSEAQLAQRLSPKILVVAPDQRLSWQYHHRRAELWKLIYGKTQVARSATDSQNEPEEMRRGEVVDLAKGERHRLVGTEEWGVVAEIWIHTDPEQASDETDIVRLSDDYARK